MSARNSPGIKSLAVVGEAAIHFEQARKTRAAARTNLSVLRRTWMQETGELYVSDQCHGVDGADEMEAALKARVDAQRDYRLAGSRLRAAIRKATKGTP